MGGRAGEGEATWVYGISCATERVKIGIAADPRKRLRELQVGSPHELTLAHTERYGERRDAVAVCEELYRHFAGRRVRGSWYWLTLAELREAFRRPAIREAPERARLAAAAAEATGRAARSAGSRRPPPKRSPKQLAYQRRRRQQLMRKQKRAARLRAERWRQDAIAADLGVTTRTLRNWKNAPAFHRELERQRTRAARKPASAAASERKPRPQREPARRRDRPRKPEPATGQQPEPAPTPASQPAIEFDDGVPIFADTAEGRTARLAYYEARKLNNLPDSGYDYTDAKRGKPPLRERRARQRRDSRHRQ